MAHVCVESRCAFVVLGNVVGVHWVRLFMGPREWYAVPMTMALIRYAIIVDIRCFRHFVGDFPGGSSSYATSEGI